MPKLQPIEHPVFGRLIPDQWNSSLMFFREFPYMPRRRDRDPEKSIQGVSEDIRPLVENWRDQPPRLAKVCRCFEVIDALEARRVYEVRVPLAGIPEPSDEQVAAYQFFGEREEAICNNVWDALLRYYQLAHQSDEGWFDLNDCPKIESQEELFPLVRFDGFCIGPSACQGLAILFLSWDPDWDTEHKLQMAVWRDQVVGIGQDDPLEILHDDADYLLWGPAHMTEAERQAFTELQAAMMPVDDFDDEDEG